MNRTFRFQLVLLAWCLSSALLLPRFEGIRRVYEAAVYPWLQSQLTGLSNRLPIALFDVTIGVGVLVLLIAWVAGIRGARATQSIRPIGQALLSTVVLLSAIYFWFVAVWGLNYSRRPIEHTASFDPARITQSAVKGLAERAVREANRAYDEAHAAGFPEVDASPTALADSLRQVTKEFGRPAPVVLASPKRSMFTPYFRASGVSGMLAPFFLETLINPDLTGPERPYVLAHEWAHLSGFAPEADAGFIGILASLRADRPSQYSAWLALVSEAASQLPAPTRAVVLQELGAGPRADQEAINIRLRALVPQVERVAWATYDRALKSQGVAEGIQSYSRVVQLLLGTDALKIAS